MVEWSEVGQVATKSILMFQVWQVSEDGVLTLRYQINNGYSLTYNTVYTGVHYFALLPVCNF